MKIAVTGKGGVGKTTISAALCYAFAEKGYKVIAIDADPDSNLASALGFPGDGTASDYARHRPGFKRSDL